MTKIPGWVKKLQNKRQWFNATSEVLELLWQARGGGTIANVLAGITAFGKGLDALYPMSGPWNTFRHMGLIEQDYALNGYICDVMMRSGLPKDQVSVDLGMQAWVWYDGEIPFMGAMYSGNQYVDGPYLLPDHKEYLKNFIQKLVWKDYSELMLSAISDTEGHSWRSSNKFRTDPLRELPDYIGDPCVDHYVKILSKYPPGPRTLLFAGPTGVGKSILARHIGKKIKGCSRTLKISSEVLKHIRHEELLGIVQFLQPSVLLLDDLNLNDEDNTQKFLAVLESLRDPDSLVIVTMMTNLKKRKKARGTWYFSGMRPDRIDEIFVLDAPNTKIRENILRFYAQVYALIISPDIMQNISKATKNLTGAYLMEYIKRLSVSGIENWRSVLDQLLMMAPSLDDEKTEEKKSVGEEKECNKIPK